MSKAYRNIVIQHNSTKPSHVNNRFHQNTLHEDKTPMAIIDEDTNFLAVNLEFEKLSGFLNHELAGSHLRNFINTMDLDLVGSSYYLSPTDTKHAPVSCTVKLYNKLGEAKDVMMTVAGVPITNQRKVSFIDLSCLKDYTSEKTGKVRLRNTRLYREKQLEMNLRQNEKYNSLIIDSITDIVYLFEITPDLNFRFLKVNDSFLKTVKLKSEQVIGKLLPEVLPNRVTELINNYLTAIRLGKPISYEEVNENGTFQTTVNPVFNSRGICTHIIVSAQNVSAKKQADEIIIFQASLLEQVRSVIVATDIAGNIIYWNKFAETFYRWKANEVFGKKHTEVLIPPARVSEVKNNITTVLKEGHWEGESINKTKDGREVIMHNVLTLITDKKGRPLGIIGISNDITEKKELENQIARLDRLNIIGEMAAGIGHEVRNPMTTIRGFLQLLTEKEDDNRKREYFAVMIKEIDRANSIITEYLSLAKNKMIHPKLQSLNSIILNLLPLIRADAAVLDKHILDELGEIPDLYLDEREIIQLILNLVRNGLEAMAFSGRVIIRTFRTEEEVVLVVQDEGEGIAPEVLEKLGTPFVTTKEKGTGLGLAVCYSIAARQKAKIAVQTSSAGTTFFVKFRQTDLNG